MAWQIHVVYSVTYDPHRRFRASAALFVFRCSHRANRLAVGNVLSMVSFKGFQPESEARSRIMRAIGGKGNRSTELALASALRKSGLKGWRRHLFLPGSPDFAYPNARLCIFVDGCFWHGCPKCYRAPRFNSAFWSAKVEANRRRDRRVTQALRHRGWRVFRIWEHSLTTPGRVVARIAAALAHR